MDTLATHRDLLAWREATDLFEVVYRDTVGFPNQETFGLTAQIRRAVVSVPSNIAEGAGRNSSGELVQFLGIACGSLAELDTQLEVAVRLGHLKPNADSDVKCGHVGMLVRTLRMSRKSYASAVKA